MASDVQSDKRLIHSVDSLFRHDYVLVCRDRSSFGKRFVLCCTTFEGTTTLLIIANRDSNMSVEADGVEVKVGHQFYNTYHMHRLATCRSCLLSNDDQNACLGMSCEG